MIRRGLRIDDDSDNEVKEERVTLDANRKKDSFEKDMDNFLFGGPPFKKRQPKKIQSQVKVQSLPVKNDVSITKKTSIEANKKIEPIINANPVPIKQKEAQKSLNSSRQLNSSRSARTPKKQENESLKSSKVSKHPSIIVPKSQLQNKILGQRQKSGIFQEIEDSRPNYIRKFKQVSELDELSDQNSKQHKFIDVVRSIQCSKNYVNRLSCLNFKDKQFPACKTSLGVQFQNYDVTWQKYQQSVQNATLGKYIDPNDIKKSVFSSNKFISTLSVLAEREQNIKRLIQDQHFNPNQGIYFTRLFINSVWRYYVVDSYLPLCERKHAGAISYDDGQSDMWVALIQKAYAKAFNGYGVFTRPQPRQYYLRDLLGAPTSNYRIDNPEIISIVRKAVQNKKVVAVVLKSSVSTLGINPNCTLAVLNANKKGGLTLRYSWPLIQDKPQIQISKQGIFDLSDTQLLEYASYVIIANVNRSYFTTTIQTRHEKQFYVAYKIIIKQSVHGYITVSQFDERLFPKEAYIYQPARLFIHKRIDQKFEYIKGGFSHMSRNLDVQVELTPGEYHVFAFINWNHHAYDFNLTFYGSKQVEFTKIPTLKNHNIISFGLQSYNLQYGKRSALGHVHQFISYHEQTNQVLITVVNTSAKNYKYLYDLQKNNFQSLHLMNLVNNEHSILENINKEELQSYKYTVLEDRKWQIQMGPNETFTWVISSSENYDLNNYRNWGFR